jgi:hypothetical protein
MRREISAITNYSGNTYNRKQAIDSEVYHAITISRHEPLFRKPGIMAGIPSLANCCSPRIISASVGA